MKLASAEEAIRLVEDGDTVAVCGCENILLPEKLLGALEAGFLATGHPRHLTEIHPLLHGMNIGVGLEHFAHEGMTDCVIGSGFSFLKTSLMTRMLLDDKLEGYVVPMGTVYALLRTAAAGSPFHLTDVGIGTFVDPRAGGGQVNARSRRELCSLELVREREYLLYPVIPIDVAIIRGTTADTNGNITLEDEPVSLGVRVLAMAARNCGGKVIAQVRRLAERGTLNPARVVVPGILVDAVVVDPSQSVSGGAALNPALTGEIRLPLETIPPLPLDARKVILRRASEEVRPGTIVNLGVGIPVDIPRIALESGRPDATTFFPEQGSIGGVPGGRAVFGTNINPEALLDSADVFDFFLGGGLDTTFLGFGQIDREGNVNVSRFGDIMPGCGGFIDITHRTKNVVFCGTFTSGGLGVEVGDGILRITAEGRNRKLVREVEQVTFNARAAGARGQRVTYVTERAVFRLEPGGMVMTEIAPGVQLERDILPGMDFRVTMSPGLRLMADRLFR
jgi:propionate CoA-transferase